PVAIRSISTDMGNWDPSSPIRLPAHTERLRIAYTATSLSMPERVRFRYRMEGIDTRWRDAGDEREAVYTDPPPGTYLFRVTAGNEDGVWNDTGAAVRITVKPAFYQTTWFGVFCVVLAFVFLWLSFYIRMRRLEGQLRARLHERHAERERIARELHDTLLQSIQGLTMRFQAIANRVPSEQPLRVAMEGALDRAEEALVEARDRVRDLRGHASEFSALDVALVDLARVYAAEHTVPVLVDAAIDMRDMDPLARDELYGIAREAVHNAIAHAQASRIDVVVRTEGAELLLRVSDDGRGIDESVMRSGRAGHWGLRGIRERASNLGGTAAFSSRLEGGTDVTVRTPMDKVFPTRSRWWRRWWRDRA
ncbi:MAG: triple tyrosine motif-containing protein, partial [Luteibacter sp.]